MIVALLSLVLQSQETVKVVEYYPDVTATIVSPAHVDKNKHVDLILYALPNGNTTAQTMGKKLVEGDDWHFDIQHIAAQTRALRDRGLKQAIIVYLEAKQKSWPAWRSGNGYDYANKRIVEIVDQLISEIGRPKNMSVTLTAHSGGGSFMTGFIDGQDSLPNWLERVAYLDANYSFEYRHAEKLTKWLRQNPRNQLVVLAYDDRNIMLDGKKVVSDSGGTWRATARMMNYLHEPFTLKTDTLGEFIRFKAKQVEFLLHPNKKNEILHTVMIGEMNGYMHAMLTGRPDYKPGDVVLKAARAYTSFVDSGITLPRPQAPAIPPRDKNAMTGSQFIAHIMMLSREEREAAIRRELFAGNIPSFLRQLKTVEVLALGNDSTLHKLTYDVMPDYLAIGSDEDFVRIPMTPYTAQDFVDAFGFVLPTRKMVNDIWQAAVIKVEPKPMTEQRESPATYLQHHRIVEEQLKGRPRDFTAGDKKDVVLTNRLTEAGKRVAIYGWHYLNGQPIQQVYIGHVDWYVDYSHGIRPVRRTMLLDGQPANFVKIATDPQLHILVSDEGPLQVLRYKQ